MTTIGEYRVGISFKPSANPTVDKIKRQAADLIDLMDRIREEDSEVARLKALAMTCIEDGSMWAA